MNPFDLDDDDDALWGFYSAGRIALTSPGGTRTKPRDVRGRQ